MSKSEGHGQSLGHHVETSVPVYELESLDGRVLGHSQPSGGFASPECPAQGRLVPPSNRSELLDHSFGYGHSLEGVSPPIESAFSMASLSPFDYRTPSLSEVEPSYAYQQFSSSPLTFDPLDSLDYQFAPLSPGSSPVTTLTQFVPKADTFICQWKSGVDGTICGQQVSMTSVAEHLHIHGIKNIARSHRVSCKWLGCTQGNMINRESIIRHVREVHLGLKRGDLRKYSEREGATASALAVGEQPAIPSKYLQTPSINTANTRDVATAEENLALSEDQEDLEIPTRQAHGTISDEVRPPKRSKGQSASARGQGGFTAQSLASGSTVPHPVPMDRGYGQFIRGLLSQWLDVLDCSARHQDLGTSYISGTCLWLYDTNEYMTWRSGNHPFLWLQGKAGSGKSVLAHCAIEHLRKSQDPVTFFYCDHQLTSTTQVMTSLICQMLHYFCEYPSWTRATSRNLIDELLKLRSYGNLDDEQLPLLVTRTAGEFLRRPLVIIDALDKCKDAEKLLDALIAWNSQGRMRIFVTSRPLQIINERLRDISPKSVISWDKLEKAVSQDIIQFIEGRLDAPKDVETRKWIISELSEKSEGIFVWVKHQVDILRRCANVSEIRKILDKSPPPADFYDGIILEVDRQKSGSKPVRRVLAWLVSALRPIRLAEIVEALLVDIDCRTMEPDQLRDDLKVPVSAASASDRRTLELEFGSTLLHVLGSLVTHNETTDCVSFIHSSMKTYLTDPSTNVRYQTDLQEAHEELAATCMCYLSLCLTGSLTSINDDPSFQITPGSDSQQSRPGSPLLEYALTKSFHHLSFLLPGNEAILGDMLALESDLQQHTDKWECLRKMASHDHPWPSVKHDFVVYTLIAFAPDWLLRAFLHRESLVCRLEQYHGTNPLIYTAHFRATEQAKTLLSLGANLHSHGWLVDDSRQAVPLVAAVYADGRSNEILELFLEQRSPIPEDLFADLVSNPSTFAFPVIKELLQTDAFVEWVERHQERRFSLHPFIPVGPSLVAEEDLADVVWRLVQVGFDPRAANPNGRTVLHLASANGYLSVVEYLLSIGMKLPNDVLFFVVCGQPGPWTSRMIRYLVSEGADARSRLSGQTQDTVLHTAIWTATSRRPSCPDSDAESDNLVEIMRTLVDAGCDPHSRDFSGYTPLHLAIIGGHVPVMKYLSRVTTPLPDDLSDAVSRAPSSVRNEIKTFLTDSHGYSFSETAAPRRRA